MAHEARLEEEDMTNPFARRISRLSWLSACAVHSTDLPRGGDELRDWNVTPARVTIRIEVC
jgi:hypothetical protein